MSPRRVVFRTAGGPTIGLGHLTRCLALAEAFAAAGHACVIAGAAPAFLAPRLAPFARVDVDEATDAWAQEAFRTAVAEADLLVTDLYAIDAAWQARAPVPVLAVTDLPLRPQAAELVVVPTHFGPLPGHPEVLTAPRHALLDPRLRARRAGPRSGRRLLVSAGGGDDRGLTARVLAGLAGRASLRALEVTVVVGALAPEARQAVLATAAALPHAEVREQVADMPALIAGHDLAVGCPAGSALERACLGLTQVLVPIADNQAALGRELDAAGAARTLAMGAPTEAIADALEGLLDDPTGRAAMAATAYALVDGQGPDRVVARAADLPRKRS